MENYQSEQQKQEVAVVRRDATSLTSLFTGWGWGVTTLGQQQGTEKGDGNEELHSPSLHVFV